MHWPPTQARTAPIHLVNDAGVAAGKHPNQVFATGAIMRGRSLYYIVHVLAPRVAPCTEWRRPQTHNI
jgi:hypothetical protein